MMQDFGLREVTCGVCGEHVPLLQYKDHAAICQLSSSLQREEFAIPITHGASLAFEGRLIQAHAAPVRSLSDVEYVVDKMQQMPPWDSSDFRPFAYRFVEYQDASTTLLEGCEDGNEYGCGDKLLHLLQKWGVHNVVLVVVRWDDGVPGRMRCRHFPLILDRAKAVLEQCYMDAVAPSTVASSGPVGDVGEATEAGGGGGGDPGDGDGSQQGGGAGQGSRPPSSVAIIQRFEDIMARRPRRTALQPPVITFSAETVRFPPGHKLCGGMKMGTKRGRVGHFMDNAPDAPGANQGPAAAAAAEADRLNRGAAAGGGGGGGG
jgi:hypothetical protein